DYKVTGVQTCALPIFGTLFLTSLAAQVNSEDLRTGPNQNWLAPIGDYFAQRHSPLTQVNRQNAGRLVPKWVRHIEGATELETTRSEERRVGKEWRARW